MACERVDLTVLVVDDDDTSLAIVANILSSWDYKVLTANSARDALKALREFDGFFDLVITEVHVSGMNGFEFQKHVKDEFQLPVIMMSTDNRKRVMSKSIENGASLYLLKPICANDLKGIWKYAMAGRQGKLAVIENELRRGEGVSPGEKIIIQDVNSSAASTVTHDTKRRRRNGKRKSSEMNKEDQSEGSSRVQKKPKIVWTTYLHNLFLLAIKHLGLDKAVPKKILEAMNVPYLTRENVASHLQKYRIFLRRVAERGIFEGLSNRTLKSRFASGLSASVIKDIQARSERLRFPVQQYLKSLAHQTENGATVNARKPSNQGPIHLHDQQVSNSAYVTTQLGKDQFPNPLYKGLNLMPQNQQSFNGYSLNQVNNMQQKMLGSYANNSVYQANHSHNPCPVFPSYGMGHGLMTSAHGLTGSLYQNYGPLGNQGFRYGLGNGNMASSSSSNMPWSSTSYPSSNSYGIQLNDGPQMVGNEIKGQFNSVGVTAAIANNNSFGLVNGTPQNANMHVVGNSGLVNGWSASADGNGCVSHELPAAAILMSNANISGLPPLPDQQVDGFGNVAGNEHHYNNNASSISSAGETIQLEDDLSKLFLMLEDTHLLNETEETPDVSECMNSDFSSSCCHVMKSLEQPQTARDALVPQTKSSTNQQNESPTSSDKNPNQDNDRFVDWEPFDRFLVESGSSGSNSAIEQDWDMEFIEAFFSTDQN